jgi:hypothetical protein
VFFHSELRLLPDYSPRAAAKVPGLTCFKTAQTQQLENYLLKMSDSRVRNLCKTLWLVIFLVYTCDCQWEKINIYSAGQVYYLKTNEVG